MGKEIISFFIVSLVLPLLITSGCSNGSSGEPHVTSPGKKAAIHFEVREGVPHYSVFFNENEIIQSSPLGFHFKDAPPLCKDFKVLGWEQKSVDETWNPVWGKNSEVKNHYNEVRIRLQEEGEPKRRMDLIARAYDDGAAFRCHFPKQENLSAFAITSEDTRINFVGKYSCFALQLGKFTTSYEKEFDEITLSDITEDSIIGMPLLVETPVCWLAVTEADLTDYAGMYLSGVKGEASSLVSKLSPLPKDKEIKVKAQAPFDTPWRVFMMGERAGDLVESDLIVNLNDPCTLEDTSWIQPGLVLWPWWNGRLPYGEPHTLQMKHYIDFAAKHEIPQLLVDAGWYSLEGDAWKQPDKEDILTMEETRKDKYDIREVIDYGKEKGVGIHLWVHGSSLERQMDEALPIYAEWGAIGIKVDSYGRDDQEWVNFVHRVAKKAAEHKLMVNYHGAYKPTGIRRTYPHIMTREGILGLEFSKWTDKPTPQHNVTIPFTRMLAGPMDYTPGAFDLDGTEKSPKKVQTTRAQQIAMHVVYFSPSQMVPDSPDAYEEAPRELEFLLRIPTVWDETKVINGKPGDYITIARRKGDEWWVASMTDENPRTLEIPLEFLDPEKKYLAVICKDGPNDDQNTERVVGLVNFVDSSSILTAKMKSSGGYAVHLKPATEEEIVRIKMHIKNQGHKEVLKKLRELGY